MLGAELPARLAFDQRQTVGRVAIDLVGAGEDEDRVGAMQPCGLEQVERAVGVDREIGLRVARRPIVRRLGGGMDDRGNRAAIAGKRSRSSAPCRGCRRRCGGTASPRFRGAAGSTPCSRRHRRRRGACRCRCRRHRNLARPGTGPLPPRSTPPIPSPQPRSSPQPPQGRLFEHRLDCGLVLRQPLHNFIQDHFHRTFRPPTGRLGDRVMIGDVVRQVGRPCRRILGRPQSPPRCGRGIARSVRQVTRYRRCRRRHCSSARNGGRNPRSEAE